MALPDMDLVETDYQAMAQRPARSLRRCSPRLCRWLDHAVDSFPGTAGPAGPPEEGERGPDLLNHQNRRYKDSNAVCTWDSHFAYRVGVLISMVLMVQK